MPMLAKTPWQLINCELGNYYSYGASDIVNIGFGWSSREVIHATRYSYENCQ